MPASSTQTAVEFLYRVLPGRKARVIRGRKIKIGTVVECLTRAVASQFGRGDKFNVNTSEGWTDDNNLEVVPTPEEVAECGEMHCDKCKRTLPGSEFIYSAWDGFGYPRYPKHGYSAGYAFYADGAHCRECEAESLSGFEKGTDGHTLAPAVLAGDLSAVCPLIDELIADGNDYRADELKRLHKLDKPARKPRKKKGAEAVAAS